MLLISFLLFVLLNARENPFFPSEGEKDILVTSNINSGKEPLKRATIALPSQARLLQKVTIEFKNLDGSIESKSIELDNAIDWHLPIFISQSYTESSKSVQVEVVPSSSKKNQNKSSGYKNILSMKHLTISSSGKNLKLITSDELIRNFLLVNPHKIVIDFKKDTDIKSYVKNVPNNIFKKIRIGNHNGYYRVVIELDGFYRYDIKKISNGYLLGLI